MNLPIQAQDQADTQTEIELERQAYLEETHIESSQFGTGKFQDRDD